MNMDEDQYKKYAKAHAPKTKSLKNCIWAFFVGGLICAFAEVLNYFIFNYFNTDEETSRSFTAIILVLLAVVLTAIGVFDNIAKHAGAGTLVPITGFANSVASPAIDSRAEGFVLGVGAKIFTVAGPVLLYGTLTGTLYGIIYYVYLLITS